MISLFIGIFIGIIVAAPIGPVGVLCIRKSLEYGLMGTLAVSLGTALADTLYASLAAFGLITFSEFLFAQNIYFKVLSGVLLLSLAIREYYSDTKKVKTPTLNSGSMIALLMSTFLITLLNPIGIVSFIALFSLFGDLFYETANTEWTVLGVFIGSFSWFLFLGRVTAHFKDRLPKKLIASVRKITAFILAGFAAFAFISII